MKKLFLFLFMLLAGSTVLAASNDTVYVDHAKLTTFGGNSAIEYTIAGPINPLTQYTLTITPQEKAGTPALEGKSINFKQSTLVDNILKLDLPGLSQEEASRYYLGEMKISSNEATPSLPAMPDLPALPMMPLGSNTITAKEVTLTLNCFQQQGKMMATAFAFTSDAAKAARGTFFVLGYRQNDKKNSAYYLYGLNSDRLPAGSTISGEMRTEKGQAPADGETYCFDGYFSTGGGDPFVISPAKPVCCKAVTSDMVGGRLQPYKKGEAKRSASISKDKKTACADNGICAQVIEESGTGFEIFAVAYEANTPDNIFVECVEEVIGWQGSDFQKDKRRYSDWHKYGSDPRDRQNSAYFAIKNVRPGMQYRCTVTFNYGSLFPRHDYGATFYATTKKVAAYIEDFCAQTPNEFSALVSTFGFNGTANYKPEVVASVLYREKGTKDWKESKATTVPDPKTLIPKINDATAYQKEISRLIEARSLSPHTAGANWCYPVGKGQYQVAIKDLLPGTTYELRPKIAVTDGHEDSNLEYEPRKVLQGRSKDEFENKDFRTGQTLSKVELDEISYSPVYESKPVFLAAKFKNQKQDFWGWFVISAQQSSEKWCTPKQHQVGPLSFIQTLSEKPTTLKICNKDNTPSDKEVSFLRMANIDYNVVAMVKHLDANGKWQTYQSDGQTFKQVSKDKSEIQDLSAQLIGKAPTLLNISAKVKSKDPSALCYFQIKEITGSGKEYYEKNYVAKAVAPKNGICSFTLSEYGTPLFWTNDIWKDYKGKTRSKDRNISQEYHLLPLSKYTVSVRLRDYTGIRLSSDKKLDKKIETPKTSAYIENVPVHVQWDDKWGSYVLTSGKNMASYGCGDASFSMALAHWYRESKNKSNGFATVWNKKTYPIICSTLDSYWKGKCLEYGSEPNPLNVQRWEEITGVASNGAWHPTVMKNKLRELGLDFEPICTHNMAQINKNYFDRNIPVIAKTSPSINSCGPQHYLLLLGFYNNKQYYLGGKEEINYIIANDPAMDHTEDKPRWINVETVVARTTGQYCGPHIVGNVATDIDNWNIDALENGAFAVFPRNEEEEKDPNYLQIVSKRSGCSLKFLNRIFYGK